MANRHHRRHVRPPRYSVTDEGIAAVCEALTREFSAVASPGTVSDVVVAAHRDLDHEVPMDAMDEFVHRLAHQRLLDICGDSHHPESRRRPRR